MATRFATNAAIPVIRSAHLTPYRCIIASVPQANPAPPTPDPAALIPFARLRLWTNHCDRMGRLGIYKKPIPQPMRTPWQICRCHIRVAKEALMKPLVRKMRPASIVRCVPNLRVRMVTKGAMSMAMEKLKPPMKA